MRDTIREIELSPGKYEVLLNLNEEHVSIKKFSGYTFKESLSLQMMWINVLDIVRAKA